MNHLFTHNDLDGVGCGILATIAFGDNVQVRYNSISSLDHQIEQFLEKSPHTLQNDFLFITDLSPNDEIVSQLNDLVNQGGQVCLIDHHKTAFHLNDFSWASVKVESEDGKLTSATSLFYEYLTKHQKMKSTPVLDEFVELVRQYDTWEWDINDNQKAKRLNDLFYLLSIDEFEDKIVKRLQEQEHFEFDEFEQKLLKMEEDKIERYIRRKKRELIQTFIEEYCVGIVHAESYHSELGNELGKEHPHIDYIAILNMGGKKISYRTIHEHVDVSKIAEQYGGGGHAKASGSSMSKQAYLQFVEDIFPLDPVRLDAIKNRFNLKGSKQGVLYDNREGEKFFIFLNSDGEWEVKKNGHTLDKRYETFDTAENELKREYFVALVKDEIYVKYLLNLIHNS